MGFWDYKGLADPNVKLPSMKEAMRYNGAFLPPDRPATPTSAAPFNFGNQLDQAVMGVPQEGALALPNMRPSPSYNSQPQRMGSQTARPPVGRTPTPPAPRKKTFNDVLNDIDVFVGNMKGKGGDALGMQQQYRDGRDMTGLNPYTNTPQGAATMPPDAGMSIDDIMHEADKRLPIGAWGALQHGRPRAKAAAADLYRSLIAGAASAGGSILDARSKYGAADLGSQAGMANQQLATGATNRKTAVDKELGAMGIDLQNKQLAENMRHNRQNEALGWYGAKHGGGSDEKAFASRVDFWNKDLLKRRIPGGVQGNMAETAQWMAATEDPSSPYAMINPSLAGRNDIAAAVVPREIYNAFLPKLSAARTSQEKYIIMSQMSDYAKKKGQFHQLSMNPFAYGYRNDKQDDALIGARAFGGPIQAGNPYLVGEDGPETRVDINLGKDSPTNWGNFGDRPDSTYSTETVGALGPEIIRPKQNGYIVPNPSTPKQPSSYISAEGYRVTDTPYNEPARTGAMRMTNETRIANPFGPGYL